MNLLQTFHLTNRGKRFARLQAARGDLNNKLVDELPAQRNVALRINLDVIRAGSPAAQRVR